MAFKAQIIKSESYDPYYKVVFFYQDNDLIIERGCAEITRKPPRPEIRFDPDTQERLKGKNTYKLELELLNTVMGFLFSTRNAKSFTVPAVNH